MTRQYAADASPPFVKVLRLLDVASGQPADVIAGPVDLHLVVTDAVSAPTVHGTLRVTVAHNVGAGWVPVAVTGAAGEYVAHLPGFANGTAVHLRVVAVDAAGNALTHYLEPAYVTVYGRVYLPVVLKDS